MHDIGAIILLIIAIVRGIFLFFRWVFRSLKRLSSPGPTYAPMQAAPQQAAPTARPAGGGRPAPMIRPTAPSAFPTPVVTREATTADFRTQEAALQADEDRPRAASRRNAPDPSDSPAPVPGLMSGPLFGTTPDLIRSLILQEALGPPLSRRRPHGSPDPS